MPVLCALAVLAGTACLRRSGFRLGAWLGRHAPVLLMALALAAAVLWLVPAEQRVQWDETNLLSTSRAMHERRVAFVATQAVFDGGILRPLEFMVDKRPPLFPFLVSLLHDLSGFRLEHAFAVNLAVFALLLAAVGVAVQRSLGAGTAVAAQLLLGSVPIAVVGARSAGFELLAAWLLALTVLAARAYVREPTRLRWLWLLAVGCLFANARYESLLVFIAILLLSLWPTRAHGWRDRRCRLVLLLLPALLSPLLLQYWHAQDPDFYSEAAGRPLVAVAHLVEHLPGLLGLLFDPRPDRPFAGVPGLLALAAVLVALWRPGLLASWSFIALPVAATAVAGLCWFYGDATEPSAQRFYLPVAMLLALGPVALRAVAPGALPVAVLLPAALAFAAVRLSAVHTGQACPRLQAARIAAAVESVLPQLEPFRNKALLVATVAQFLVLRDCGAVSPDGFERHAGTLRALRREGELREVFFVVTPADALQSPRFGSVRELMQRVTTALFTTADGEVPVAVYRMVNR